MISVFDSPRCVWMFCINREGGNGRKYFRIFWELSVMKRGFDSDQQWKNRFGVGELVVTVAETALHCDPNCDWQDDSSRLLVPGRLVMVLSENRRYGVRWGVQVVYPGGVGYVYYTMLKRV